MVPVLLGNALQEAKDGNEVETILETPAPTLVVGMPSGPSWLRHDFVIPEELNALH